MHVDSEECAARSQIIEALKTLLTRVEATRRVYSAGEARLDAVAQEKRTLLESLNNVLPPSILAFLAFLSLLWFGILGLVLAQHNGIGALLGTISLFAMIWYKRRIERSARMEAHLTECSARLDTCSSELRATEREAREIELAIRELTGKNEVSQADIDERVAELDRILKLNEEARGFD